MIRTVWRILLLVWLVSVWIVISVPGGGFDGAPHWESIQWIPFGGAGVTETVANFLAFIPVGYLALRSFVSGIRRPLLVAGLLGLAASFSIEIYQVFCPSRFPSVTDLVVNTAGTLVGAQLALNLDDLINFLSRRTRLSSLKSEVS